MATNTEELTPDEVVTRGKAIYEKDIRAQVQHRQAADDRCSVW